MFPSILYSFDTLSDDQYVKLILKNNDDFNKLAPYLSIGTGSKGGGYHRGIDKI